MSAHGKTTVVQKTTETPMDHFREPQGPIASSLAKGELPSNTDINQAIEQAKGSLENTRIDGDLSTRGQQLAKDTEDILSSAQRFINEKNRDGKLQDLVRHTREATEEVSMEVNKVGSGPHLPSFLTARQKAGMAKDATRAYNHGKDLAMFILRSTDFRSYIIELIEFFQSMVMGSAEKLNRIGETLKQDIQSNDKYMSSTYSEAKQIGKETVDSFYNTKYEWTQERRDEIYSKFRSLMERASQTREWRQILNIFWKWLDQMRVRAEITKERLSSRVDLMKEKVEDSHARLHESSAFDKMWEDVKAIIDEFAGQGSFDSFYNQTWDLYCDLINDAEADQFFYDVKLFMNEAMDYPESLASEEKTQEGQRLIERGRVLMNSEKYQYNFRSMFYNGKELLYRIRDDAATQDFKEKLKKFGEHFALDANGKPDLYAIQESTVQLKNLVYPLIKEKLGHMKVNKISGTSDKYDYEIEDLVVCVPDLLPKSFELQTKSDMQVDFEEKNSREMSFKVQLDLAKLKPVFKDVKFWYKRKTFPKIEDRGTVDVDLSAGDGTRIKIVWKIKAAAEKSFTFSLIDVKATVDKMDIHIKNAKHEALDKFATSLFVGKIKQSIAQSIVDGIVKALQPLNDQMNQWFASRPVGIYADRANAGLTTALEKSNQAIKDPERLKEKARDAVDAVRYKAESGKDRISAETQEIKLQAQEKIGDVKEDLSSTKQSMDQKTQHSSVLYAAQSSYPTSYPASYPAETLDDETWDHSWSHDAQLTEPSYDPSYDSGMFKKTADEIFPTTNATLNTQATLQQKEEQRLQNDAAQSYNPFQMK